MSNRFPARQARGRGRGGPCSKGGDIGHPCLEGLEVAVDVSDAGEASGRLRRGSGDGELESRDVRNLEAVGARSDGRNSPGDTKLRDLGPEEIVEGDHILSSVGVGADRGSRVEGSLSGCRHPTGLCLSFPWESEGKKWGGRCCTSKENRSSVVSTTRSSWGKIPEEHAHEGPTCPAPSTTSGLPPDFHLRLRKPFAASSPTNYASPHHRSEPVSFRLRKGSA